MTSPPATSPLATKTTAPPSPATTDRRTPARARWPRRRVVVAAVLTPALLAGLIALGGGLPASPAWVALVAGVALTSAGALATYVPLPGTGAGLDLGCSPCAAGAGLAVLAAALLVSSTPHDVPTAMLALAASGFALRQRLAAPTACAAPRG